MLFLPEGETEGKVLSSVVETVSREEEEEEEEGGTKGKRKRKRGTMVCDKQKEGARLWQPMTDPENRSEFPRIRVGNESGGFRQQQT